MKGYLLFFLIFTHLGMQQEVFQAVKKPLENNDIRSLYSMMDTELELCLFQNENLVTRSEAINQLEGFMKGKEVQKFNIVHKGASQNKIAQYFIADMITDVATYRTYVYFKKDMDQFLIQELRITED